MKRPIEMCSFEMFLLQIMNVNDKVMIIADTRHTRRWSERKIDPTLCKGDLLPNHIGKHASVGTHERAPGIPRNAEDLEKVKFADVLGAISEDQHLTRCAQVCFAGTEEDQAERHDQGTIDEGMGNQDMEKEGTPWKKLTEKLICSNRCNYLVTQSPRKNV